METNLSINLSNNEFIVESIRVGVDVEPSDCNPDALTWNMSVSFF